MRLSLHYLSRLAAFISLGVVAPLASSATFFVTSTADQISFTDTLKRCTSGTGICRLREAIWLANQTGSLDTINLTKGTYKLTLTGGHEDNNLKGDLDVKSLIIINGAGSANTIIDGNLTDRIFHLQSGELTLNNVTLQNGRTPNTDSVGGAIALGTEVFVGGFTNQWMLEEQFGLKLTINNSIIKNNRGRYWGGAIANFPGNKDNVLKITNSQFLTNVLLTEDGIPNNSIAQGGGIFFSGATTIDNSTFIGNVAEGMGGAVHLQGRGTITKTVFNKNVATFWGAGLSLWSSNLWNNQFTLSEVTIDENTSLVGRAGGIAVEGKATMDKVTISRNFGGALMTSRDADVEITNSTISGNTNASKVVENTGGTLKLTYVTIANNHMDGIGHHVANPNLPPVTEITNSIITGQAFSNCENGTVLVSKGNNLDDDGSCGLNQATDIIGKDPLLAPLANNGGFTKTHALGFNSPAVNKANINIGPKVDQRGVTRPLGVKPDIGAYELLQVVVPCLGCIPPDM